MFRLSFSAAVVLSLAIPTVQGLTSSFVPRRIGFVRASPRSSTMLSMNLFDRFSRVAKSNLNNILQNLEDPEKIMSQGRVLHGADIDIRMQISNAPFISVWCLISS
jgi:hypothetical protein